MSPTRSLMAVLVLGLSGCGAEDYFQRIDLPQTQAAAQKPWPRLADNPEITTPPAASTTDGELQALYHAAQLRAQAAQETIILDDTFHQRRERAQARAAQQAAR